jgi:hypothetical protein
VSGAGTPTAASRIGLASDLKRTILSPGFCDTDPLLDVSVTCDLPQGHATPLRHVQEGFERARKSRRICNISMAHHDVARPPRARPLALWSLMVIRVISSVVPALIVI